MAWGTIALWTALSPLITGGAAAGATAYGAKKSASASSKAAAASGDAAVRAAEIQAQSDREAIAAQERASAEALALQREQLAWQQGLERQARADWEARQAALQPYRDISAALMGRPLSAVGTGPAMPAGWRAGASAGPTGAPTSAAPSAQAAPTTVLQQPAPRSLAAIASNPDLMGPPPAGMVPYVPDPVAMPGVAAPDGGTPVGGQWDVRDPYGSWIPGYDWAAGPEGGQVISPWDPSPPPQPPLRDPRLVFPRTVQSKPPPPLRTPEEMVAWRMRYAPRTIAPRPMPPLGYVAASQSGPPLRPARRLSQIR